MKTRFITEKDFLPVVITNNERHTEVDDGLFQIAYGVMQDGMIYDFIYDLVVRLSKEQKNDVVKRFKLLAWKVEVEAILTKLRKISTNEFRVMVVIPFTKYVEDVAYTIDLFQFALYTINQILDKGDAQMTTTASLGYKMPPKSIRDMLGDYYVEFMEALQPEKWKTYRPYYRELFFDEMIRRGMTEFKSDEIVVDPDTKEMVGCQEFIQLMPSQNFNQPEKFFDIMDLTSEEEWKKLRIKFESEESGDSNNTAGSKSTSDNNEYTLGTVGTVFFMLKDLSQEAVAKKNKKKLVALMNYILDNKPDDDTARSYVDKLFGITAKSHSFKFYRWVRNHLGMFGFEVPKVVKEGYENKMR